ncbi:MAG: 5'/3'-nucleotidase SurE [Desulfobacteraceae bacterium]|nr:5'/3'-nucleotidase SurE [Desulfobacteraceae bacterium]
MRILLTNDDGIHAVGLCALYEALADENDVFVVAPDSERSAVGHAITIADPLRARLVKKNKEPFGWAVSGTPADCVKLAVHELIRQPVDLVVSGINQGANIGASVLYSGTVSAATEGAMLNIRSAAFSLEGYRDGDFCLAASIAKELISLIAGLDIPKSVALNINIPALPLNRIAGFKITRQAVAMLDEQFDRRVDPRGNIYYWQSDVSVSYFEDDNTDILALKNGFISITPIHFDLTAYNMLNKLLCLDFNKI